MKSLLIAIAIFGIESVYSTPNEAKHYFENGLQMQQQGNKTAAISNFNKSVQLYKQSLGDRSEMTQGAKIFLARAYGDSGDIQHAIQTIVDVLKTEQKIHGEKSPEFASSLNDLGNFYGSIKKYEDAKQVFEMAYNINKEKLGSKDPDTITCLESLIQVSLDIGDLNKAVGYLRDEINISLQNKNTMKAPLIKSSIRLAQLYENNGVNDYSEAAKIYSSLYQDKEIMSSLSDPDKASLMHGLAEAYEFSGSYAKALPLYINSVELFKCSLGEENNLTIVGYNDISSLYQAIGQPEMAYPIAEKVLSLRKKTDGINSESYINASINYAASCQALHKNNQALDLYKNIITYYETKKRSDDRVVGDILLNLAGIYEEEQNLTEAYQTLNKAHSIFESTCGKSHYQTASALNALAGLCLKMGNPQEALVYALQANKIILNNGGYNQRNIGEIENLYSVYKTLHDNQKAKDVGLQWINIQNQYLPNMLMLGESQRLAFSSSLSFSIPVELLENTDLSSLVMKWKGVVADSLLADRMIYKKIEKKENSSDVISQIQSLKNKIAGIAINNGGSSEFQISELRQKIDTLESGMTDQYQNVGQFLTSVDLKKIQSALNTSDSVIDFFTYKGVNNCSNCYGVSLLGRDVPPKTLLIGSSEKIDEAINAYKKAIISGNEASLKTQIQILSDNLWKPIAAALPPDTRKIFIGADGPLNFLSFATLQDDQGRFISEKYQIAYVGSGRDLLRPAKPLGNKNMLIYANPIFATDDGSKVAATDTNASPAIGMRAVELKEFAKVQLPQLPGTEQESSMVSQIAKDSQWSGETHLGAEASKKRLMSMKAPAVLHLATHGFFLGGEEGGGEGERGMKVAAASDASTPAASANPKPLKISPMRQSGVALTGGQSTLQAWGRGEFPDPSNDGILTAEEVAGLDLNGTWLVTLSACETGVGQVQSGEGVFGLRRAFMMAGAQNLMMTLWPVSDETTPKIMADFYKKALASGDAAGSLSDVQRDWLVKLRQEKGLLVAVRDAGPFAMAVMANPNLKQQVDTNSAPPSTTSSSQSTSSPLTGASQEALDDCVHKTKSILNQKIQQNDPSIQKLCSVRFKTLLKAGLYAPSGEQCALDADFRYDTQDDYPKINSTGPAVQNGEKISVPVELQFGTNAPLTKTWVFTNENGPWLLDDVLTQKAGGITKSMAEELAKLPSLPSSVISSVQTSSTLTSAIQNGGSSSVLEFSDALAKADAGDAYAQGVVSIYYTMGYKAPKDTSKGLTYAMKSAAQKNPLGIYQVGALRELGSGMKKDKAQAHKLMSAAFDGLNTLSGDPYALYDLAYMAIAGIGVNQNPKEAARLFKASADLGYAPSQRMYAKFLEAGVGVPKDMEAARQYQSQSSAQWSEQ